MTLEQVMSELESMANEQTKKILTNHGAKEPFFGVKVGDLKKLTKKIKKDHDLALKLYNTGNSDAMYLAALIADEKQITKEQLQHWADKAYWYMISEYTVAWIAADSTYGFEMGLKWIESDNEFVATAGWSTLSNWCSVQPDEQLDTDKYFELLDRVERDIHTMPNRVRYTMNGFVISVGCYIKELNDKALQVGNNIGKVNVDVGGTACKVPVATDYIHKVMQKDRLGKKRKMARC